MNRDMQSALQRCLAAGAAQPLSECVRLLLDAVQQQARQISRLEEIVAAQVADPVGGSLQTQNLDLQTQVSGLQQQVSDMQEAAAAWRAHQDAQEAQRAALRQQQLQQERRLGAVEQQLGLSANGAGSHAPVAAPAAGEHQSSSSPGVCQSPGPELAAAAAAGTSGRSSRVAPAAGAGGLVTERLRRLEQRVATLTDHEAAQEEHLSSTSSRVRGLEGTIRAELAALRGEVAQAVRSAAVSASSEAAGLVAGRTRELEKGMMEHMDRLSASVDARIAAVGARVADSVVGDMDARLAALGEEVQLQLKELSGQLSALSSGKADASALTQYTSQVTQVFEQLAGTVVSSSQESMQELQAQVQQVRMQVASLASTKADQEAVQQQRDAHSEDLYALQQDLTGLRSSLAEVAAVARTAPAAVEGVRLEVAEVTGRLEALQLSVSGLQGSTAATSRNLDSSAQRVQQLSSRCQVLQQQVGQLSLEVLGPNGAAAMAAASSLASGSGPVAAAHAMGGSNGFTGDDLQQKGNGAQDCDDDASTDSNCDNSQRQQGRGRSSRHTIKAHKEVAWGVGLPVAARLARLEASFQDLAADVVGKAASEDVADLAQQLDATQSQVASCCDAVRALTQTTYRRVDEHASAIQRLTAAISSSVEDRPTAASVKVLIADALSVERREAGTALEAVAAGLRAEHQQQQLGLQDLGAAMQEAAQQMEELKQEQAKQQAASDSTSATLSAVREQLEEAAQTWQDQLLLVQQQVDRDTEVEARAIVQELIDHQLPAALSGPNKQLAALAGRLAALTDQLEEMAGDLGAHKQQQAEQQEVLTRLEAQLSSGTTPAAQQLRSEMVAAVEACAAAAGQLAELQEAVVDHKQQLAEVRQLVPQLVPRDTLRGAVLRGAEGVARALLDQYKQQDDVRWQVWLEKFADGLEARLTRTEAEQLLTATTKAALLKADAVARSSASKAAGLATGQAVDAVGSRMAAVEGRLEQMEVVVVRHVTQQQQQQQATAASPGGDSSRLAEAASGPAGVSAEDWADLVQQIADKADAQEVQEQLSEVKQQLLRGLQQVMLRGEVEAALAKKLDIASYLAATADSLALS